MKIRIAARQSDLARLQAFQVGRSLKKLRPDIHIEYQFRSSLGDQRADDPLWKMPEKGVFTEDFVADLRDSKVEMVVHSWKDLPILEREVSMIAATLSRADSRDVLLVHKERWNKRCAGEIGGVFRVLTSSPRRTHCLGPLLKWALPWPERVESGRDQIEFHPVRGNIATRVSKLVSPESYRVSGSPDLSIAPDALVVAKAALDRLLTASEYSSDAPEFNESESKLRAALSKTDFVVLPLSLNPSAAAQGALAIEIRRDRTDLLELCRLIDSSSDRRCVELERAELARHGGGCHQKIGVTVVERPYGTVRFRRGVTDQGQVLDQIGLLDLDGGGGELKSISVTEEPWVDEGLETERRVLPLNADSYEMLKAHDLLVARFDAWPTAGGQTQQEFDRGDSYVWTAGLRTWKKLAADGVWVTGSAEGFGENEDPRIDVLASACRPERPIKWLRLTHDSANSTGTTKSLATYRVSYRMKDPGALKRARTFFWKSRGQFEAAVQADSSILEPGRGFHLVGPGRTFDFVQSYLRKRGWTESQLRERLIIRLIEST